MNLLTRLAWKSLPKNQRKLLLSLVSEPNRQIVNTILSGKTAFPKTFDDNKFIFIHVPKVAGISLIHALGFSDEHKWHMPLKYYELSLPENYHKYFKFAFVRNPWDRALSAYKFLLKGGISERDKALSDVVQKYPDYESFVLNWLSPESSLSLIHFTPMYNFLENSHGVVSLDFIGRYETLQSDYDQIRTHLGYGESLPWKNTSGKNNFRDVYTTQMIDKIAKIYERDITEFNYDY